MWLQAKKSIMKMLKGHVVEIAKLEFGHLVILALFDTVDDTVLLKKVWTSPVCGSICIIWKFSDQSSKLLILRIVQKRNKREKLLQKKWKVSRWKEHTNLIKNIQSLAILLDAPSIFSISIVLWVHMTHCSVTIVVYRCNNV